MTFSIPKIIWEFFAPKHRLSCSTRLWNKGLEELQRRTEGKHESGAFLLGYQEKDRRRITHFIFYDDLDPKAFETGIVVLDGASYGPLWRLCHETGLSVIADIHVHGGSNQQSISDRENPMIATSGHIALIVPCLAKRVFMPSELGIYEYEGEHKWRVWGGESANNFFYVGFWG